MTVYLIKSGICLLLLLAAYLLLLEKEKMLRFNRFFLLASLVLSLTIPVFTIQLPAVKLPMARIAPVQYILDNDISATVTTHHHIPTNNITIPGDVLPLSFYLLITYAIIVCILFIRFIRNLLVIYASIQNNTQVTSYNATIVLVPGDIIPYSFSKYIFVSKNAYENSAIENELLLHELTHVNQKHTLDILFIEMLKVIFWFNPVFILYKRAIQLNHEFLADEGV
ncbi:hypothetical protein FFF34_002060 [Inquilinus sp. KBS0705]|nr:hypothetical protein FFF34_002060 [Inquilinus sp. KBS0705]